MKINKYFKQLTNEEIKANYHRVLVGGMWEELGELQFNYLKEVGLKPHHRLIDVGCGALRGGIKFLAYLDKGNYHGIDINASLIAAGQLEAEKAGLSDKEPHLLVDDKFAMSKFDRQFDFALALSVFTHLPMNHIIRCLVEIKKVMVPNGVLLASFFQAPASAYIADIWHDPGEIHTHYDQDPFHYSFSEFEWMAQLAGMEATLVGNWEHPKNQQMLKFTL